MPCWTRILSLFSSVHCSTTGRRGRFVFTERFNSYPIGEQKRSAIVDLPIVRPCPELVTRPKRESLLLREFRIEKDVERRNLAVADDDNIEPGVLGRLAFRARAPCKNPPVV
jgi:hypothetical protein